MTIKKIIFIIIFIGSIVNLQAQEDSTLSNQNFKVIFGFETGGTIVVILDPITREKSRYVSLRFVPHISVYFKNQLGIGIQYEYNFAKTPEEKLPSLYGYGVYLRYYPKFHYKSKFFRERFLINLDAVYAVSNYYSIKESPGTFITDKINNKRLEFIILTNWRIFKGLHLVHGLRFQKDLRSKGLSDFNFPVGFQYHF